MGALEINPVKVIISTKQDDLFGLSLFPKFESEKLTDGARSEAFGGIFQNHIAGKCSCLWPGAILNWTVLSPLA